MSNTKSTLKNMFLLYFLPVLSLFSFLFYVFWAYPVQILSQELAINSYFLFNNPYLQTSLLVCIVLFIALIITSKKSPKLFPYILGLILFFLIGTFLYKITSYDFGTFIDNNSLTTSKSILGYSFWYFTFDIIFPILSIIITVFILKKNFYKPILLLLLLFYSTENITTLINLKIQEPTETTITLLTLSKNHKNVLVYMLDSLSPNILRENLTNLWTDDVKAWSKDFTFYDNVTGLSPETTVGSLPSLIGGYDFTIQKQIGYYLKDTNTIISNSLIPFYSHYLIELALKSIEENLQKTPISVMTSININEKIFSSKDSKTVIPSSKLSYLQIPILSASLYRFTPYIFKNNLANTGDPKLSFGWRSLLNIRWIQCPPPIINMKVQDTAKPIFQFLIDDGLHTPFSYTDGAYDIYKAKSTKDVENLFSDVLQYRMERLNTFIKILKENNIYDNTRIILTSDHGTQHGPKGTLIKQYLKEISTDEEFLFYQNYDWVLPEFIEEKLVYHNHDWQLPVFIMDKNFNTSQPSMKTDSRFLSLGDLNNTIKSSFDTNYIDYLITMPPKRAFNVIAMFYPLSLYLNGSRNKHAIKIFNEFENNLSQHSFYKIRDIKTSDYDIIPLSNITSLSELIQMPTIEYLE